MIMGAQPFSGVLISGSRRPALNMMRRRRGFSDLPNPVPPNTVGMVPPARRSAPSWGGPNSPIAGHPPGWWTARQQSQANPLAQQTTLSYRLPPWQPLSPQPPAPTIVNPSPSSQPTSTGTSATTATSVLSQANGTSLSTTPVVTSTGDWFSDPTQEIISGLPNWGLVAIGAAGLFMIMTLAIKR